jgi:hypothetical protein
VHRLTIIAGITAPIGSIADGSGERGGSARFLIEEVAPGAQPYLRSSAI